MAYRDRVTACVSSQAGCAMACGFCATGQAGFERHLTTGEIVEQVVRGRPLGARPRAAAVQRRVHGHGRAVRQLRPHVGGGRAHPRRPRPVGPPHHALDGRRRPGHPTASPARPSRSTSRCRCTRPTTTCATSSCRSTAATRSTCWPRPAAATSTPPAGGSRSSGRSSPASTTPTSRPAASPRIARPLGAHVNLIPLNPTPGYPTRGSSPAAVRDVPRAAAGPRRQRDRPAHPRHRDRRRLRPAAGRPRWRCARPDEPLPDEHGQLAGADRVDEVLARLDHRAGPHHGALEHRRRVDLAPGPITDAPPLASRLARR